MKQKALILSGCIAATAPMVSVADVLPDSLIGLNLGEIRTSSFLNQPFKGVIPFLFTSYENSKALDVRLAPASIFNKVGAEKYPILNSLHFQVTQQDNKPVILISSDRPINLPFLNFVLEINGPEGIVYQDYTVLLDPETKQSSQVDVQYVDVNSTSETSTANTYAETEVQSQNTNESIIDNALLANLSSRTTAVSNQNLKYRVKAGDSLSKIAQRQNVNNTSLKTLSRIIYQKNPKAFIRGDVNRLKKGVVLKLPTASEINGFEVARKNIKAKKKAASHKKVNTKSVTQADNTKTYKVVKGDSLSKITKKYAGKGISFTKLMNEIYTKNPTAFINRSKNKIKAGAEILIPSLEEIELATKIATKKSDVNEAETMDANEVEFVVQENQLENVDTEKPLDTVQASGEENKTISEKPETLAEKVGTEPKELVLRDDQYRIQEGDRLANLAKDLGHKGIPFPNMMKAIYTYNPEAFVGGNMAKLVVGAVITIPSRSYLKNNSTYKKKTKKTVTKVKKKTLPKTKVVTATVNKTSKASGQDLIKRIRELRKQLSQAKQELSTMKRSLGDKELLLNQKDMQLESLNAMLMKLNGNSVASIVPVKAAENLTKVKPEKPPLNENIYKPKSKAEMAKLKRDLLNRQKSTNAKIKGMLDDKHIALLAKKSGMVEADTVFSFLESKSNLAYSTLALLLGLLLIRYRRQLYSYTYSKITYEHPNYYPAPELGSYDLKEKNLNFSEPKREKTHPDYEFLSANNIQTGTDAINESNNKRATEDKTAEVETIINPLLIEATEDIFATSTDLDNITKTEKKYEEIEHCEDLVSELFENEASDEDRQDDREWQKIENVCDSTI